MTIDRKSLINWVGGKRLLRKVIAPLIPKDIIFLHRAIWWRCLDSILQRQMGRFGNIQRFR